MGVGTSLPREGAFVLIVLMIVALLTDLPGVLEAVFTPWMAMGVDLPLVFVVATLLTYRRRRLSEYQGAG
ncbi:hypothetical protein QNN03_07625 [Streptomyces sp. GXMU-J15]|uniref:Uncharacterized protein n=1 Tax=Streptomyces fuscus TaxID=3048495 RepID=A0ABT7IXQ2_9ACTN|nr:hypothetical protein [Streptomyces fuscus]MDL2076307.1 hypothetical protein [Streptomyces fuscus]